MAIFSPLKGLLRLTKATKANGEKFANLAALLRRPDRGQTCLLHWRRATAAEMAELAAQSAMSARTLVSFLPFVMMFAAPVHPS